MISGADLGLSRKDMIKVLPELTLPLTVTSRRENDHAILELTGSLTLNPALTTVREAVRQILKTHPVTEMVLDLAAVTAVDSSGLGELTVIYTMTTQHQCPLRLAGVNARLKKMLDLAGRHE